MQPLIYFFGPSQIGLAGFLRGRAKIVHVSLVNGSAFPLPQGTEVLHEESTPCVVRKMSTFSRMDAPDQAQYKNLPNLFGKDKSRDLLLHQLKLQECLTPTPQKVYF